MGMSHFINIISPHFSAQDMNISPGGYDGSTLMLSPKSLSSVLLIIQLIRAQLTIFRRIIGMSRVPGVKSCQRFLYQERCSWSQSWYIDIFGSAMYTSSHAMVMYLACAMGYGGVGLVRTRRHGFWYKAECSKQRILAAKNKSIFILPTK
ncbi:hypothetical protein BDZ91DRAFT_465223 [Kalaharituber pfeilii]|nr:hypothetical protein BDZ91DRAFT_465223 [Kalaharituber pfeilii]